MALFNFKIGDLVKSLDADRAPGKIGRIIALPRSSPIACVQMKGSKGPHSIKLENLQIHRPPRRRIRRRA